MDKNWMFASRMTEEYAHGVEKFVEFALQNANELAKIHCPFNECLNAKRKDARGLKDDLVEHGIDLTYKFWRWHCEKENTDSKVTIDEEPGFEVDQLEELIQAVADFTDYGPKILDGILNDAREPLYASCTNFTKLSTILKLYNLKASHGWTDRSFTALLELLKSILPDDNVHPDSTYEAKKFVRSLSMDYQRIRACPNDCILYRNEYESYQQCPNPKCGASWYKREGVPAKVLWYFPIIPRLKRMFPHAKDAKY